MSSYCERCIQQQHSFSSPTCQIWIWSHLCKPEIILKLLEDILQRRRDLVRQGVCRYGEGETLGHTWCMVWILAKNHSFDFVRWGLKQCSEDIFAIRKYLLSCPLLSQNQADLLQIILVPLFPQILTPMWAHQLAGYFL